MLDQQIVIGEFTVSRSALEAAIVIEIKDYFLGTDWQNSLESGGPLIARYALARVLRDEAGTGTVLAT